MTSLFLQKLQAYNLNGGLIRSLDIMERIAVAAEDYFYKGYPLPGSDIDRLDPLATYEAQVDVAPGSWLTAVSAYSEQPEGFVLQAVEVSSQAEFYTGLSMRSTCLGNFSNNALDTPMGPTIIESPMIVLNKGRINIEIKNMSPLSNRVQVLFEFAIPNMSGNTGRIAITRN